LPRFLGVEFGEVTANALTSLLLIAGCATRALPACAAKADNTIAIGGVSGFNSLTNKGAIRKILATGRVGYYLHFSATNPKYFNLSSLAPTFAGTGNGIVEVSLGGGFNVAFWSTAWKRFPAAGFHPAAAVVNLDNNPKPFTSSWDKLADFKAFVDAGRSIGGVSLFAPIVSPNSSGGPCGPSCDADTLAEAHPWADAYWNEVRAAATYGGGLALDAPPAFYFGLPDETQRRAYQRFTQDAIAWATDKGLWVNFLVSPYFDYPNFLANAEKEYANLLAAKTLPSNWTILNYEVCGDPFPNPCLREKSPAFGAPVGDEDTPNTVASVTLWFAQHVRVRRYSGEYAGVLAPD
jgi:hypothetical protein